MLFKIVGYIVSALKMLSQKQAEGDGGCEGNDDGSVTPSGISNGEGSKEFLSTGRTGRRNAMPDILGRNAKTGTADLSRRLEALTTDSEQGIYYFFLSIEKSLFISI